MNILFVTSRAIEVNASSSIRNLATIKGLIENGHTITVCSMRPDPNNKYYDPNSQQLEVRKIYFKPEMVAAVKTAQRFNIFHTKLYRMLRGKRLYDGSKQIVNHVEEVNLSNFDIIISSSDPKSSHLFVEKLFERNGKHIPWIQIWGDPFASDMTVHGDKRFIKKATEEESRLLSECDSVIYVSLATLEYQKKAFPNSSKKMHYLPIPYLKKRILDNREKDNTFSIVYCGDYLSNIRNISPLYQAVNGMDGFRLDICGDSDIKLANSNNVSVRGRISYQEASTLEDNANILVMICNLSGNQIPGKIYQFAGTNKPILFVLDGNKKIFREQFQKYNRFVFCDNDSKSIRENLLKIRNENKKYLPLEDFDPKIVASKILQTINESELIK